MRLIDADKLIEALMCEKDECFHFAIDKLPSRDRHMVMSTLRRVIVKAPSAAFNDEDDRISHGYWLDNGTLNDWTCSVCGVDCYVDEDFSPLTEDAFTMRYCHYCGARMDLGADR